MPTALIVEDEREANKLLSKLVQLRGYQTESAFDGAEALEKVRNHIPDVIFLDLMLPDLDGYDVCRSLKASGTTGQIPVIIVTARVAAGNRIESYCAGADDYIPKPYTPDQIYAALDQSQTWKQQIAAPRIQGEAMLDGRDDGETLRRLAQLRSLLLARTALGAEAIERINTAIKAIWSSVDEWARRRRLARAATLAYELTNLSLILTIHDEGGWLASSPEADLGGISSLVANGRFDEVITDRESRCLKLVKRLDAGSALEGRGNDP